jgi:ABC-2 type transport system permease protein
LENNEHVLLKANEWFEWGAKAGVVMYGLRDLLGEDSINSALRDFKNEYAFKNSPPFAGTNDLFRVLQKHTPDSLQYYLEDNWKKITLYDNKLINVAVAPTGKKDEYSVTLTVDIAKVWVDEKGNDISATAMNDYIDIGLFAANSIDKAGRTEVHPLYLKRYKFTAGTHKISIIIKGKPVRAGIDPYAKLIDRQPNDNVKEF